MRGSFRKVRLGVDFDIYRGETPRIWEDCVHHVEGVGVGDEVTLGSWMT